MNNSNLKNIANYVPGCGWYLKPIASPDQPECTPSDFLGRNKADAIIELARRQEIEDNN